MILRRMEANKEADKMLTNIELEMDIIENMAYHKANLFYKGKLQLAELYSQNEQESPSNDALDYGIANWYFYIGNKAKAKEWMEKILQRKSWSSFGYIAAEKDYLTHFEKK